MLKGKTILLGVTGSIAAYKAANLASLLKKRGCDVNVIMTENAANFINPITFETLTEHKCLIDTFDRSFEYNVEHISLAKKTDGVLIAPASANVIGKIANGIADDMLTTTLMACTCPAVVAPAMNTNMYRNPIVQDNIRKLQHYGYTVVQPASGLLACGDVGEGKMPDERLLIDALEREIACAKDMAGMKVLVTAGPTQESMDPVRYITNHSTGKMGYEIARACMLRGADVTLVSGPTSLTPPPFVEVVPIRSATDMFEAVTSRSTDCQLVIKAAAVADYTPAQVNEDKTKKSDSDMSIPLTRTTDILKYLGEHKQPGQLLCGFSMETRDLLENSRAKLSKKNADMIVANNLKVSGAGFGTDTNVVTLITREQTEQLPLLSKGQVAHAILDRLMAMRTGSARED